MTKTAKTTKTTRTRPKPPAHLSPSAAKWFASVVRSWRLDPHHVLQLQICCECWDEYQAAAAVLRDEGETYRDRFDAPRTHPAVAQRRDSRLAFLRALRELDLNPSTGPAGTRPDNGYHP